MINRTHLSRNPALFTRTTQPHAHLRTSTGRLLMYKLKSVSFRPSPPQWPFFNVVFLPFVVSGRFARPVILDRCVAMRCDSWKSILNTRPSVRITTPRLVSTAITRVIRVPPPPGLFTCPFAYVFATFPRCNCPADPFRLVYRPVSPNGCLTCVLMLLWIFYWQYLSCGILIPPRPETGKGIFNN